MLLVQCLALFDVYGSDIFAFLCVSYRSMKGLKGKLDVLCPAASDRDTLKDKAVSIPKVGGLTLLKFLQKCHSLDANETFLLISSTPRCS